MLRPGAMTSGVDTSHRGRTAPHPLLVALGTTALVTALSYGLPLEHSAAGVGVAFLAVTYALVLRRDEATIRRYGLSLGGLLEPGRIDLRRVARRGAVAFAYCLAICALVLPPFVVGFRLYWRVRPQFAFTLPDSFLDEVLGQLLVIALPEEAFYRGYLQTALDERLGTRWKVLGAKLGPGLFVGAAIFAVGHLATELRPDRLAVFFPALLFGWLRARTGGIGAPLLLHAIFNLFAALLARGYGLSS